GDKGYCYIPYSYMCNPKRCSQAYAVRAMGTDPKEEEEHIKSTWDWVDDVDYSWSHRHPETSHGDYDSVNDDCIVVEFRQPYDFWNHPQPYRDVIFGDATAEDYRRKNYDAHNTQGRFDMNNIEGGMYGVIRNFNNSNMQRGIPVMDSNFNNSNMQRAMPVMGSNFFCFRI
ncbi:unnamed protein product, partial [Didymodactylos carnosus]